MCGDQNGPIPLVNVHIDETKCEYRHIPVELTCAATLPKEIKSFGAAFRVIDVEGAPLLASAVRLGTFLYLYQIKAILASLEGVPPLEKGAGSGKNGSFVKLDYSVQLVKFLFPDAEAEEQMVMVKHMCFPGTVKMAEKEKAILEYLDALDVENQQAFKEVKTMAKSDIEKWDDEGLRKKLGLPSKRQMTAQAAAPPEVASTEPCDDKEKKRTHPETAPSTEVADAVERAPKRSHVTPKEFKDLFPIESEGKMHCFFDAAQRCYRVSYPASSLSH